MKNTFLSEKEKAVLNFLESGPKTTKEIVDFVKLSGFECNDRSIEVLPSLEKRGLIDKLYHPEKKSFVWKRKYPKILKRNTRNQTN